MLGMKRRNVLLGCVVISLCLAAPGVEAESKDTSGRLPCVARARAVAVDDAVHELQGRTRRQRQHSLFSAYETHTLELDLLCRPEAPSPEELRLKLFLPNGDLYRELSVTEEAAETERTDGADATRRRRRRRLRPVATARLPVAGTFITQYQLFGSWRVEVCWAEGSRQICKKALQFSLER